jgi:hypothetical protein
MSDFLFTWKPNRWPYRELRSCIDDFESNREVAIEWRCAAHRKVRFGDNAYLLKQGEPRGIFGRGTIAGIPKKVRRRHKGSNPWFVPIRFDASLGEVLWDPTEQFLVDAAQLRRLSAHEQRWRNQASGISLEFAAAREIDRIIFDSIRVGRLETAPTDEILLDVLRRRKLAEMLIRPDQQVFRQMILNNYRDRCAVTGCCTPAVLDAAHISTKPGLDNNSATNGLLLRSDIHALFDRFLITLSEDGSRLEISSELEDSSYDSLRSVVIARPLKHPPSKENIQEHRRLFFEKQNLRAGSVSKR